MTARLVGWSDDPLSQAVGRLQVAEDHLDERAPMILTYHALLQQEMMFALARLIPSPEMLAGLGFKNLTKVLGAVWPLGHAIEGRDRVVAALTTFNELRNSIGHGHKRATVDAHLRKLATQVTGEDLEPGYTVEQLAAGITLQLALATGFFTLPAPPAPPPATT
jgi:hypothetical protein